MPPTSSIEQRSIDFIPAEERHGTARSLLFVWFAANTSITAVVTGALFVILGNSALWSIPAIVIGNIAGGFFTSLHSAQGPRLGVPQMIQSRAQFGYFGAILPLVLALMIFLGFYATGPVLGGQAIADLLHVSQQVGSVIFALMSTTLAIFGYRHIHRFSHFAAVLSGPGLPRSVRQDPRRPRAGRRAGQRRLRARSLHPGRIAGRLVAADVRSLHRRLLALPARKHAQVGHHRLDVPRQRPWRLAGDDARRLRRRPRRRCVPWPTGWATSPTWAGSSAR
ncbi:purine-cytosine permease family protein [Nocardioides sp. B-3]|uniref:purine-cytosine permease family protein n=1 Tax=Nocardioides sp. B-3 TaxID=2895565 RepID=UPI0021523A82|nr:cytosine permease [Nocardioides sp. B-3]UUZ60331.1 cytosine permease [Nocardioides sp. B-3]